MARAASSALLIGAAGEVRQGGGRLRAHLLQHPINDLHERLHHHRVEVDPGLFLDQRQGALVGPGLAVGAVRGEGVVHVADGQDARGQRDVLARQSVRVAGPVPLLVVVLDDRQDGPGERDRVEDGRADLRVLLDLGELLLRQPPRLEQDVLRDAEFADVVQQRPGRQAVQVVPGQPHVPGGGDGVALDAQDVLVGVLVLGVNGEREALDGRQVQVGHAS